MVRRFGTVPPTHTAVYTQAVAACLLTGDLIAIIEKVFFFRGYRTGGYRRTKMDFLRERNPITKIIIANLN